MIQLYDVAEKMNDMLMACVRIKVSWMVGMGSYLEIKDPDIF
jgi:hypothetical protein